MRLPCFGVVVWSFHPPTAHGLGAPTDIQASLVDAAEDVAFFFCRDRALEPFERGLVLVEHRQAVSYLVNAAADAFVVDSTERVAPFTGRDGPLEPTARRFELPDRR